MHVTVLTTQADLLSVLLASYPYQVTRYIKHFWN